MATKDINFKTRVTGTGAAKGKIKSVETTAVSSAGKMSAAFAKMGGMLAAAFGGAMILRLFSGAIDKFKVQELAVRKLDTALGYATKSLQDYAAGLQKVTTFGDENIINAMALIGMFVKEEDKIKKLTVATLDFAASKGVDLAMASDLIVKTFASSTNALSRYGLIVEGAAGSNERLNSLLQAMSVYGGQAEAMAKTLTGQLEQLNNELGDQQEEIGERLIPIWVSLNQVFNFSTRLLMDIADLFGANTKVAKELVKEQEKLKDQVKEIAFDYLEFQRQLSVTDELFNALGIEIPKVTTAITDEIPVVDGLTGGIKKLNDELEEARMRLLGLNDAFEGGGGLTGEGGEAGTHTIRTGRTANAPIKVLSEGTQAGLKDGFEKAGQMMEGVSRQWTSTLESNFNEFWDSTFGYANSLLEQLLKMTFTGILSQALSFLPGGGILTGIASLFSSPSGGNNNTSNNMIVLKIGDEEVSRFVSKGNEYNRMRRLN